MKLKNVLLVSLTLPLTLLADLDVWPPLPGCKDVQEQTDCQYPEDRRLKRSILLQNAKGLVLASAEEHLFTGEELGEVDGVVISGEYNLEPNRTLIERLNGMIQGPIDPETIDAMKIEIHHYYQSRGFPFVQVYVPEQDVTDGVLQIVVQESRFGKAETQGNRWFNSCLLENAICAVPGEVINLNTVMRDLNFLNRSPFMRVDAIYTPGDEPNTTDIVLMVKDQRPLRVSGTVDNAGIDTTNRGRGIASIQYGKMWGLNHTWGLQFISSLDSDKFRAYSTQYQALLSWHHILTLNGGYSHVKGVRLGFPTMTNHGNSYQGSLRYGIPLEPWGRLNQDISFGADFKRTNNTVEFSELFPTFGKNTNLTQLVFGYAGNYEVPRFRLDWDAEVFWSPGEIVSDQSNSDYDSLRPGAKNKYVYGTTSVRLLQWMPLDFSILIWMRGQLANQNLLPSEQAGIGGFSTVRGYEERQLNTDRAFILNTEIRTPYYPFLSRKGLKGYSEGFQFLLFFDYGYGRNHTPIPIEGKSQFLLGAGPGARYNLDPWLYARLDWGFKWHSSEEFGFGGSMIHFSVNASL